MRVLQLVFVVAIPFAQACDRNYSRDEAEPAVVDSKPSISGVNTPELLEVAIESDRLRDRAFNDLLLLRLRQATNAQERYNIVAQIAKPDDRAAVELLMEVLTWEDADLLIKDDRGVVMPPLSMIVMRNLQSRLEEGPTPRKVIYPLEDKHLWIEWWETREGELKFMRSAASRKRSAAATLRSHEGRPK